MKDSQSLIAGSFLPPRRIARSFRNDPRSRRGSSPSPAGRKVCRSRRSHHSEATRGCHGNLPPSRIHLRSSGRHACKNKKYRRPIVQDRDVSIDMLVCTVNATLTMIMRVKIAVPPAFLYTIASELIVFAKESRICRCDACLAMRGERSSSPSSQAARGIVNFGPRRPRVGELVPTVYSKKQHPAQDS